MQSSGVLGIAQEISPLRAGDLFELQGGVANAEVCLQFGIDLFKNPVGC